MRDDELLKTFDSLLDALSQRLHGQPSEYKVVRKEDFDALNKAFVHLEKKLNDEKYLYKN